MPLEIKPGVGFAESTPGASETFGALANTQLRAGDSNAARAFNQSHRKLLPCARLGERQLRFSPQAIERFISDGGCLQISDAQKGDVRDAA